MPAKRPLPGRVLRLRRHVRAPGRRSRRSPRRYAADRRPAQWARSKRGEITAWEYNLEILDGLPVGVGRARGVPGHDRARSRRAQPARRGARNASAAVPDPSDGFDWNLDRLQTPERHPLRPTPRTTCASSTASGGSAQARPTRAAAAAPACARATCCARCARRARARHLVHIGNGRVSDTCGALAADTAFAKDSLARDASSKRGAPFVRFATLHDVIPHLAAGTRALTPRQASPRAARRSRAEFIERADTSRHVLVVGAGLAGLAAAWRPRAPGCRVTVLERGSARRRSPRGRARGGLSARAGARARGRWPTRDCWRGSASSVCATRSCPRSRSSPRSRARDGLHKTSSCARCATCARISGVRRWDGWRLGAAAAAARALRRRALAFGAAAEREPDTTTAASRTSRGSTSAPERARALDGAGRVRGARSAIPSR